MLTPFEQAITFIKVGDIEKGKQLLIEVLKQNPKDEKAWLWMTRCLTDPEQKRYCFDRVLKINPQNQYALEGLKRLEDSVPAMLQTKAMQEQAVEKKQPASTGIVAQNQRGETIPNRMKKLWTSGLGGKAVIGCASLFAFCCLCSIPVLIFRPAIPAPAPTAILSGLLTTQVDAATQIHLPTDTLAATNYPAVTNTLALIATQTAAPLSTLTLIPIAQGASCIPGNPPPTGKVVNVVDGDTIKVALDQDGQTYTVRYIGMDTPESTTQVEYFGAEASMQNLQLVSGKNVTLIKDVSETDRYGRLLRYVIVDGLFINYELVAQGYANTASFPPDIACIPTFQAAEQKARASGLGLWNAPPTLAPLPTVAPSVGNAPCNCSGMDLDCKDFSTHSQAQACYNNCLAQGFGDVFRLDGNDNDGLACESLP
jgi:micrococcal nuclease